MVFKVDTAAKVIYITEDINYNDFINFCNKIGVNHEWTIKKDTEYTYIPYYPTVPNTAPGTTPCPPWEGPTITYMTSNTK